MTLPREIADVLTGEKRFALLQGDSFDVMRGRPIVVGGELDRFFGMPDNCIDSMVCDPPAGVSFMNLDFDSDRGGRDSWVAWLTNIMREALRVLKPGAHGLVWSLPRTSYWTALALDDAGFEIRDVVSHLTASGFPKSLNISRIGSADGKACACSGEVVRDVSAAVPAARLSENQRQEADAILLESLPRSVALDRSEEARSHGEHRAAWEGHDNAGSKAQRRAARSEESSVEGWGDVFQEARQLQADQVRQVPAGVRPDGAQGRICDGASTHNCQDGEAPIAASGSRSSRRSRPAKQRPGEPGTVAGQSESQVGGAWQICGRCNKPRLPGGLGTALKPSAEFWWLVRKPVRGTIIQNVLDHGTGAINIDACRVPHASASDLEAHAAGVAAIKERGGSMDGSWKNSSDLSGANDVTAAGRWPANCLLSHSAGCELVGTKKVKAAPSWNDNRGPSLFTGETTSPVHHADGDGFELVDDWRCEEECPVRILDLQSGESRSGESRGTGGIWSGTSNVPCGPQHGDVGGASRYFKTFAPFFYTPKAGRSDREQGLEHLQPRSGGEATGRVDGSDGLKSPRAGAGRNGGRRNDHPTVKSDELMRYLCRLVTPPNGICLDMFMGSGSTGKACSAEGFRFIGVELDAHYCEIARARIEAENPLFNRAGGVR